uniref:RING-type domain-containing protein n=1 Tax=Macrostomum lignano TaxID=282301 RepID=A0A1I8I2R5_9PLAT
MAKLLFPEPAELLLKASRPNQLCCFAAFKARRQNPAAMTDDTEEESVLVYRPQSMLFPSSPDLSMTSSRTSTSSPMSLTVRQVNSGESAETRLRSTVVEVFPTAAQCVTSRHHLPLATSSPSRLSIDSRLSLPSLVDSVLRWRTSSPAGSPAGTSEAVDAGKMARRRQRRRMHQSDRLQRRTWDGSGDTSVCPIKMVGSPEETSSQARSDPDDTAHNGCFKDEAIPTVERFDDQSDVRSDDDSNIVEIYLDSILENLPDEVDPQGSADFTGKEVADGPNTGECVDLDELLLLAETADDAADKANATAGSDLVELARGQAAVSAEVSGTSTKTPRETSGVDCPDGWRRLSATGSEPATDEFSFIRVRVLPTPTPTTLPASVTTTATMPRLRRAATMAAPATTLAAPQRFWPEAAGGSSSTSTRRRFHKRRQSYILNRTHEQRKPGDKNQNSVVLTGARRSLGTPVAKPEQPSLPQPPPSSAARLPSSAPVRAVIFHPPSQAGRAAYLANYLASSGQPASIWSSGELLAEVANNRSESKLPRWQQRPRIQQAARLLRDGLSFRRSSRRYSKSGAGAAAATADPADVLVACAKRNYLPVVLLPACDPTDDAY